MSFCFLLYLWMPPQKNMQRGNWLGNGYLCIVYSTHEFCLLKASLSDSASVNVRWCWRGCLWTVKCKHCMTCILMLEIIRCYWFLLIRWVTLNSMKCKVFIFSSILFFLLLSKFQVDNAVDSMLLYT